MILQKLIASADVNQSNDLSLAEFVNYVQEHEQKLLLVFSTLDANSDGKWRYFLFIFFLWMGTQNRHVVPLLKSVSRKKGKKKAKTSKGKRLIK